MDGKSDGENARKEMSSVSIDMQALNNVEDVIEKRANTHIAIDERITCDDLGEQECDTLKRQRTFSCPDISNEELVDSRNDTEKVSFDTKMSNQQNIRKVGKLDARIFSDVIRKQGSETESADVINWALEYFEQLFVVLSQRVTEIMDEKSNSSDLFTTIVEDYEDSTTILPDKEFRLSKYDTDDQNNCPEKTTTSMKSIDEMVVLESELTAEQLHVDKRMIKENDDLYENISDEKEIKSKIGSIILNMYEVFVENIPEPALQHSMNKVRPLFKDLKEIITLELATNYTRSNNVSSKAPSIPAVSGPPPPAPPPPPPPKEIVLNIKVKTMGRTLSVAESNVADGSSDIETRIKSKPKKDDMMAQLQAKLQARQRRESLALKMSKLK